MEPPPPPTAANPRSLSYPFWFYHVSLKTHRCNHLFRLLFPYQGSRIPKQLTLNKSVCFSLVHLAFVAWLPAENADKYVKKQNSTAYILKIVLALFNDL